MLHGQWSEAEQEARQACDELERFGLLDAVGYAQYEMGEVRLRMGDLDGPPKPSTARTSTATTRSPASRSCSWRAARSTRRASIERALAAAAGGGGAADRATRARLLPAQIDIALAAGDLETAGPAVDGARIDRRRLRATRVPGRRAHGARRAAPRRGPAGGGVAGPGPVVAALAGDRPAVRERAGAPALRRGAGRRRRPGGGSTRPAGCPQRVRAARREARPGACRRAPGGGAPARRPMAKRVTRTFMFTDIVTSTDLVGLIGDDAWGELLRWHDRELRSAFAQHRGEEVEHTGDGFFVAFERAVDGDRVRRSTSSGGWRAIAASTGSRRGCGSGSTRPRQRARAATTAARACTSRRASAPPRGRGRSSSRRGAGRDRRGPVRAVRTAPGQPERRQGAGRGAERRLAVAGDSYVLPPRMWTFGRASGRVTGVYSSTHGPLSVDTCGAHDVQIRPRGLVARHARPDGVRCRAHRAVAGSFSESRCPLGITQRRTAYGRAAQRRAEPYAA